MSLRFLFDTEGMMAPIDRVKQHPKNDNNGDVDEIVASMQRTGVYRPIYVSRATGHIVAGNHTYVALLELGAKAVPVVWLDLNETQELLILAADNKIARNARPDPALTEELLSAIRDAAPDLGLIGTGYSDEDWERLSRPAAPLSFTSHGVESLTHTIECPECGHSWVRGK